MDSITCPICGMTSYHPEDVRQGYCGNCHAFTRDCILGPCTQTPARILGNVSVCSEHDAELHGVSMWQDELTVERRME